MNHFEDKDASGHIEEKRGEIFSFREEHGTELPGHLLAGADAARETALFLFFAFTGLQFFSLTFFQVFIFLISLASALITWKIGRSAWLGWSRLERYHRLLSQEKLEIEHNPQQEREELLALYATKGLESPLLEQVVDVLMSDKDRLLKVMMEEELGLALTTYEHPLKQGCGAGIGALAASFLSLALLYFFPPAGLSIALAITLGSASYFSAKVEKNPPLPAIVWNLALAFLASGVFYFIFKMMN